MKLSLNEGQMTISMEFVATDDKPITVEEVLIGAYDIISRAFSQEEVIRAYYRADPGDDVICSDEHFFHCDWFFVCGRKLHRDCHLAFIE